MRVSWFRIPLLLLCTVLAFAGTAGDGYGRMLDPTAQVDFALPVGDLQVQTESLSGLDKPVGLALVPAPRPSVRLPAPGVGRTGRVLARTISLPSAAAVHFCGRPTAAVHCQILARACLAFTHPLAMARMGALSSHGTSLPPPLLA